MKRFLAMFCAALMMSAGFVGNSYATPADGATFHPVGSATSDRVDQNATEENNAPPVAITATRAVRLDTELPFTLTIQLFGAVFHQFYPPLWPVDATDEQIAEAFKKFTRDLMEGGFSQATGDPHSHYFSPKNAQNLKEQMQGSFDGGVGMSLLDRGSYILITQIIPNSPAAQSGMVRPGDMILEVNGHAVAGKLLNDVVSEIRGEIGTEVKLKIRRGNKEHVITLKRAKIVVPMVRYEEVSSEIAYIGVLQFGRDVSQKFFDITRQNIKDKRLLIVDLRNNPGGGLKEVHRMSCFFADRKEDIAVTVRGRLKKETLACATEGDAMSFKDLRVVVLVNGYSASASEIFSGVLQDWHKAIIVGEGTYGKGSVQIVLPMDDGGQVNVTIAEYLVGNNRVKVNKIGVKPDKVVHNAPVTSDDDARYITKDALDPTNDAQLAAAIKVLNEMGIRPDVSQQK